MASSNDDLNLVDGYLGGNPDQIELEVEADQAAEAELEAKRAAILAGPHHIVDGEPVALTQAEIDELAQRDATFAAQAPDRARAALVDDSARTAITSLTFGPVTPKTVVDLKGMTWADYSTWFDSNFTTAALLIALVKRMLFVIIRRVL